MQPDENLANAIHPQLIASEGIEELSTSELIQASQSRALKTVGVSPARLREQMNTWIQLHYREGVSGVLLMLSRAYGLDRDLGGKGTKPDAEVWRSLEAVLSGLPENLVCFVILVMCYHFLTLILAQRSRIGRRLG